LYLRSFDDDTTAARLKGELTEEEHLVRVLSFFGPVIAIGKPGEVLPLAGAQRIYVSDDGWQQQVTALIGRARLVVIRTGLSPGLRWELDAVIEKAPPERILLAGDDAGELEALLRHVQTLRPATPLQLHFGKKKLASLIGFVGFRADWQAVAMPIRRPNVLIERHEHDTFMYAALLHTLRPVFENAGVEFPRAPKDPLKIGYGLFCVAFIVWVIAQCVA
jgi:hypothetical protein